MSQIVDLNGNPITTQLDEMQTEDSKLAHLQRHFAEHPSSGLTPGKLASILMDAEQSNLQLQSELAADMEEKDGHIFSELQKRRRALLNLEWSVMAPRNASAAEQRDVDMLNELLDDMTDLDDLILNMSDAMLKGFSNHELEWRKVDGLRIAVPHFRDPSWFQTHPEHRNQLRLRDQGNHEGAELRAMGWISHIHQAKSGYVGQSALARVLAWPFLFKNYSVRDLAEFLEIYGLPLRLGKYPQGASDKEKNTLLNAVMSIGHNAGGIIPKGMDIDFQEAAKGAADPFEAMINWCERTQSKAILGGTLTSQADGKTSTNALGNVHNEVRQELRDSDAKQIASTLTRDLIFPLYMLNGKSFSGQRRIPRFEFDLTEPEDIAIYSQHLPGLVDRGLQVPVNWLQDKLKIPEPQEGEEVLGMRQAPAVGLKAQPMAALKVDAETDPIEELGEQLVSANDDVLKQIMSLAQGAESFDKLKEQLLALQVDLGPQANLIGDALTIAQLAGRYDIVAEAL